MGEEMLLYRIEHSTDAKENQAPFRRGPYSLLGEGKRWYQETDTDQHPLYEDEKPGGMRTASMYFGFASLEQLKKWFKRHHRRELRAHYFVCRVYEGEGEALEYQAVLYRDTVKEVRTLKSSEWVE